MVAFCQIVLGGWIRTNYAALACIDFPTCHASFPPPADHAQGFHVLRELGMSPEGIPLSNEALNAIRWTHRVGAGLTLLLVGGMARAAVRLKPLRPFAVRAGDSDRHQQHRVPSAPMAGGGSQRRRGILTDVAIDAKLSSFPPSRLPRLVSCPTDSRPKTRRESAPCCDRLARRTFRYLIVYLSLPFVALLADHYWRVPI